MDNIAQSWTGELYKLVVENMNWKEVQELLVAQEYF